LEAVVMDTTVGVPRPRPDADAEWNLHDGAHDWDHQFALAVLYDDDTDDPRAAAPDHLAAL
jgi:hypothetical protein